MAATVQINIKIERYPWREFLRDVLRVVWLSRPIFSFLGEVVSEAKKILLFVSAIVFGILSMIFIFGIPVLFIYSVLTQRFP